MYVAVAHLFFYIHYKFQTNTSFMFTFYSSYSYSKNLTIEQAQTAKQSKLACQAAPHQVTLHCIDYRNHSQDQVMFLQSQIVYKTKH